MNQKATRKITPAAVRLLALDAVRGAVIGMLIGTGGSKVLLAAALPERKLNLLHRPFAKVGKAALMLYIAPFVLAWILMLFGLTSFSSLCTISRRGCCGPHHHTGCWLDRIFDKAYLM